MRLVIGPTLNAETEKLIIREQKVARPTLPNMCIPQKDRQRERVRACVCSSKIKCNQICWISISKPIKIRNGECVVIRFTLIALKFLSEKKWSSGTSKSLMIVICLQYSQHLKRNNFSSVTFFMRLLIKTSD